MFSKLLAATVGIAIAGGAASAQTVGQRQDNQTRRIDNGVASGRLTPGEAARDERQQARINEQKDRMRDRNGGHLNASQRARLQNHEDRASQHIYNSKHNGRGY